MSADHKGSVLIALIIAILMMSILGAGVYSLSTASSFSQVFANYDDNAYELARAGIRYAAKENQTLTTQQTFYMPDSKHLFQVSISNGIITSTGIVNQGSFWQASRTLTYNVSWAPQASQSSSSNPDTINFNNDMPSFGSPGTNGSSAAIQTTGNGLNMGGSVYNSSGADWYQGSSIVGSCINGACSFGVGLNVYFNFAFLTQDSCSNSECSADGFTFAVINAINNTRTSTGGAPSGVSEGELMGYAGPGNTSNGLGLVPPKMALQFDTYPNPAGNICSAGSRNDPYFNTGNSGSADNVSLMFWGARTISGNCDTSYPESSFDDNEHGAGGTGTDPRNNTGPGDAGYYQFPGPGIGYPCLSSPATTCNWLEDGYTYSARIEIVRPTSSGGSDANGTYYNYEIKAWVLRLDQPAPGTTGAATALQTSHLKDVLAPFSDFTPQINKTIKIYSADHANFNQIFFGFTEATGAATQQITVTNFEAFFPQSTCSSPTPGISPSNAAFGASGGSSSVSVTPSSTCPWQATSTVNWITITSGASGTGNGTVNYTVAANNGPAQTGYIDIAGATFTVTQSSGCTALSTYTIFNETNTTIYPQRTDGSCHSGDSISSGSSYSIAYNAAAVKFYPGRGSGNSCTGTPISINGPSAFAADANCDGNVQINSSWQLVDY